MSRITLYTAGPVTGCNDSEAKRWRNRIDSALFNVNPRIISVSPVRCENSKGNKFAADSSGHFHTPKGISTKNWFDTERCDLVLCYMPKEHFSLGTTIELGWAIGMRKPIILVTDDEFVSENPLVQHSVAYVVFSEKTLSLDEDIPEKVLEEIVEIVTGLCEVYV